MSKKANHLSPFNIQLSRKILRWLWEVSQGTRCSILLVTALGIVGVFVGLLDIWVYKWVIDIATKDVEGSLLLAGGVAVGVLLLTMGLGVFQSWVNVRLQVKAGNQMRHRLFQRLLASRWNELEQYHSGDVLNRIERDGGAIVGLLTTTVPSFVISVLQFLAGFIFFCYLDYRLALLSASFLPLLMLGARFYGSRMRRYNHQIKQSGSHIQAVMQESIQHRTVIKSMEQGENHLSKLESYQTTLSDQIDVRTRFSLVSKSIMQLGFSGGYILAFLWSAYRLSLGQITFGTITAMLQLVNKVQRPAFDLTRMVPTFVGAITAAERLMELEDLPMEDVSNRVLFKEAPLLVFDQVGFRYDDAEAEVLRNLSITLVPGSRCALIGETGAGKTTMIRLLLAFAFPTTGRVYLKDREQELAVSAYTRCNFVYVPQGNSLLSGTIRDNLLMGDIQATDEAMTEALRHAQAHFVFDLPNSIDTSINELGGGLSEGQAQRIAIARALLRPGQILLLDEASSALDSKTEAALLDALFTEYPNKTILFITHDQAIVDRCDQTIQLIKQ